MIRIGRIVRNLLKFLIVCCSLCVTVIILSYYPETERVSARKKHLDEGVTLQLVAKLKDFHEWIVKPPENVFGSDAVVGELGAAVSLPKHLPERIKTLVEDGWERHQFNQYVSDLISVNRSLSDFRSESCKSTWLRTNFPPSLPKTAVIITFYNEAWSTLLRTVHSVLNRGGNYVQEVVLVDDHSTMLHLKEPLEKYMKKLPKVRIIRTEERVGLIRARILGVKSSTAPVLTFLDSHVECAEGWLEPLLARIAKNSSTVVSPVIDIIDDKTFEFQWIKDPNSIPIGGFDWRLGYKWVNTFEERGDVSLPLETPAIAGGLFSISRSFFERLGMYDDQLELWGGENFELSFKTWMCGGSLEIHPCSHVGHVFRTKSPYESSEGKVAIKKNLIRVSQVWMDEYAKFFLMRIHAQESDFTDVTARRAHRARLRCRDFKWYLESVYPTQFDPALAPAQGKLKSVKFGGMCVAMTPTIVKLDTCQHLIEQFIVLTINGELRRDDFCVSSHRNGAIKYSYCIGLESERVWTFSRETNLLHHGTTRKCLAVDSEHNLVLLECNELAAEQRWTFEYLKSIHY